MPGLRFFSLVTLLLLAGCGETPPEQALGAEGPVVFRAWPANGDGPAPSVIVCDRAVQRGDDPSSLDLTPVRLRHLLKDGRLWLHAPAATTRAQATTIAAPIVIDGRWRGEAVVGRASDGELGAGGKHLRVQQIELIRGWDRLTASAATLDQDRLTLLPPVRVEPAPAIIAGMLAVLPP